MIFWLPVLLNDILEFASRFNGAFERADGLLAFRQFAHCATDFASGVSDFSKFERAAH